MEPTTTSVSLKDQAVSFLELASSGKVREAYDRFVGTGFRHHNPHFRGDASSLETGGAESAATNPNKTFSVRHVLQDGDLVATWWRFTVTSSSERARIWRSFTCSDSLAARSPNSGTLRRRFPRRRRMNTACADLPSARRR